MTWLRLLSSPLVWAMGFALAAAGLFWLWSEAREANAALRAENRGLHEAARVTTRFLAGERERSANLILSLEELADVPETFGCGPGVTRALDLLRQ